MIKNLVRWEKNYDG